MLSLYIGLFLNREFIYAVLIALIHIMVHKYQKIIFIVKVSQVNPFCQASPANTNLQMRIGPAETADYQQTAYSQPSALAHIQAKEADVQALAELTRALEKKVYMIH